MEPVCAREAVASSMARAMVPPFERMRLANECKRLLRAADPPVLPPRVPSDGTPRRPKSGVLAELRDGDRSL
jgi:hypothetical protein